VNVPNLREMRVSSGNTVLQDLCGLSAG
jgi:hypothetical protein